MRHREVGAQQVKGVDEHEKTSRRGNRTVSVGGVERQTGTGKVSGRIKGNKQKRLLSETLS